jgi:2-iminobutanoate/2-iminopropanoate deaminase
VLLRRENSFLTLLALWAASILIQAAVVGDTIEKQTRLVLDYIGAKRESRGLGFENVVMSHVFMAELNDFRAMNGVYSEYFPTGLPARATIEASRLPRDVLIEIAVVAYIP